MMRILIVYGNKNSRTGGVESWAAALFRSYRGTGHVCQLFWLGQNVLPGEADSKHGDLADLMRLVARTRFDVVHAVTTDWDLGVSIVKRVGRGCKLVVTNQLESRRLWDSRRCDALTSCSTWSAHEQAMLTDLPVHLVFNGIDTDRFVPPVAMAEGPPIVAWVGRGSALAHKRIDRLAAVAPALRAAGLRIWIADPDGPDGVETKTAALLKPLAEFWGSVTQAEMPRFLQQVSASGGCVLCTAAYEGLPLSLAEAQACGCLVIGSDVRGVNECVRPERGGVLYRANISASELASLVLQTVRDIVKMSQRRRGLAQFAREQFALSVMARRFLEIYTGLLDDSDRPRGGVRRIPTTKSAGEARRLREEQWSAADAQYFAALKLLSAREWRLGRVAFFSSVLQYPFYYARPARVVRLIHAAARNFSTQPTHGQIAARRRPGFAAVDLNPV